MKATRFGSFVFALVALVGSGPVQAGDGAEMREVGNYIVHYNAMSADRLDDTLARRYALPRSGDHCVLTVAITERGSGTQVAASVMAQAARQDGRMHQIQMREIRDGDDIYYVGVVELKRAGELEFILQVQPARDRPPENIRFRRRFHALGD